MTPPVLSEAVELPVRALKAQSARWDKWQGAIPVAVFLFGLALRIFHITHEGVGGDEAYSMTMSQLPVGTMLRGLAEDFVHPPLHYFMLRGWFDMFGFGVPQARLSSVLFGSLSVVLLYLFARYLFDRRAALLSSLLLAISQLAVWFAQEPRPYAQFQFLAICTSYFFVRAFREGRTLYWWGFVGLSILMIYTDYFGVFVLAALALYAAIYRKRVRLRRSWVLSGAALALALYMPWMVIVAHKPGENRKTFGGRQSYSETHWFTALTAVNAFNNGKPEGLRDSSPWWTFVVGGALFGLPLALALKKRLHNHAGCDPLKRFNAEAVDMVSILWVLPLCLVIGLGFTLHIPYNLRYVLFCAAPYYVLVASGISELSSAAFRWGLVVLILAFGANSLRANYFMRWKEDWPEAFAYVERNHQEGDCGIFLPFPHTARVHRSAAAFWNTVPTQWGITQAGRPSPFTVIPEENLGAGLSQCNRIWDVSFAPRGEGIWWAQADADARPVETVFSKIEEKRYFGVRVSLYSRKERLAQNF